MMNICYGRKMDRSEEFLEGSISWSWCLCECNVRNNIACRRVNIFGEHYREIELCLTNILNVTILFNELCIGDMKAVSMPARDDNVQKKPLIQGERVKVKMKVLSSITR